MMTGRTFGRRGVNGGGTAAPRAAFGAAPARPERPAARMPVDNGDEMSKRRAAFLAEEHARKARPRPDNDLAASPAAGPSAPVFVREKSLMAAFALWFFAGAAGGHRFYLGFPLSGVIQLSLWAGSWAMIVSGRYEAFVGLIVSGTWVVVDGFLVKGMHKRANERARRAATADAFA